MNSKEIILEDILDDLSAQDIASRLKCTHPMAVEAY